MIQLGKKLYTPTPLMIWISSIVVLMAGFMVEGATTLDHLILPICVGVIFGYIALSGKHDR